MYSTVLSDGRLIRGRPALLEKWRTAWVKRNEPKRPIPTVAADAFDKTVYNDKYSNITNRHEGTTPIAKWDVNGRGIGDTYPITRHAFFWQVAAEVYESEMHARHR